MFQSHDVILSVGFFVLHVASRLAFQSKASIYGSKEVEQEEASLSQVTAGQTKKKG